MTAALRRLSIETYLIALIGMVDLLATIALLQSERAVEGNPLMNFYLSHGLVTFAVMKGVFTAMPLVILEWARRRRPEFVRKLSRVAIATYVGMYGVMFLKVNVPTLMAERHEKPTWSNANNIGVTEVSRMRLASKTD